MGRLDDEELGEVLSELFEESVSIDRAMQRDTADATLAVVDMSYRRTQRHSEGPTTFTLVQQTAIVLSEEELDLPQFSLSPKMGGIGGAIFAVLGGFGDINFNDSPVFSKQYVLHGWSEHPVRILFTKKIRDYFASHGQWSVRGKRSRLVIFKESEICGEEDTNTFVNAALEVLSLFQEAEESLDARPDVRRETRVDDIAATARRMGGIAGPIIERQLRRIAISPDELETFLRQSPPRQIPSGMKRQVLGHNFPLIFIGAMFFIVGIVAGTCIMVFATGYERLIGVPFLLIFPIVGGLMSTLTFFHRRKNGRMLRHGELVQGTIAKVQRASKTANHQEQYAVTFSFASMGQQRSATIDVNSIVADKAREAESNGSEVRLLVDPKDPDSVLCPDLFMVFQG